MNVRMNYWNIMFSTPCPVVGGRVKSCDGSTFTYGRSRFCISNNCLLKLWKDGRSSQSRDQQASIISYLEWRRRNSESIHFNTQILIQFHDSINIFLFYIKQEIIFNAYSTFNDSMKHSMLMYIQCSINQSRFNKLFNVQWAIQFSVHIQYIFNRH